MADHPMRALSLVSLFVLAPVVLAHDFWIEPSTFTPDAGAAVAVRLRVGENHRGETITRRPADRLVRFEVRTPAGTMPVGGAAGADPAGSVRLEPGLGVIVYQSKPVFLQLSEARLRRYLAEEGLEHIHDVRARSPYAEMPWRELFSRNAKALVCSGLSCGGDQIAGLPLELVAEENPYALRAGAMLPVRLLHEGQPLANALVVFIPKDAPERRIALRSDANGRVEARLDSAGAWLVKAVHVAPASNDPRAQWQSLWASLTFELPR